jgi:hypothetical protein
MLRLGKTYLRSARQYRRKRRQPCSAATRSWAGAIHNCSRVSASVVLPLRPPFGQPWTGQCGDVLVVLHGLGIWLSHWGSHSSRCAYVESQVEG